MITNVLVTRESKTIHLNEIYETVNIKALEQALKGKGLDDYQILFLDEAFANIKDAVANKPMTIVAFSDKEIQTLVILLGSSTLEASFRKQLLHKLTEELEHLR